MLASEVQWPLSWSVYVRKAAYPQVKYDPWNGVDLQTGGRCSKVHECVVADCSSRSALFNLFWWAARDEVPTRSSLHTGSAHRASKVDCEGGKESTPVYLLASLSEFQ